MSKIHISSSKNRELIEKLFRIYASLDVAHIAIYHTINHDQKVEELLLSLHSLVGGLAQQTLQIASELRELESKVQDDH